MEHYKKVKILNIIGWGRSGSTILGSVLGEIDDFFFGGEIRTIWTHTLLKNRLCGCGIPSKECNLWKSILEKAFGNLENINPQEMITLMKSGSRTSHIPLWRNFLKTNLGIYLTNLEKLYRAIYDVTGCKVIIDSSKSSGYSNLLSMVPSFDLYVVHLLRDPRAVTYSWQRKKILPDKSENLKFNNYGVLGSSLRWSIRNLASEVFWRKYSKRYLIMKYEDFIDNPKAATSQIMKLLNEEPKNLPFISDHSVNLGTNHALWGNPSRFKTGTIELKKDEEWKEKMKQKDKFLSTLLTFPMLLKYGYCSTVHKLYKLMK